MKKKTLRGGKVGVGPIPKTKEWGLAKEEKHWEGGEDPGATLFLCGKTKIGEGCNRKTCGLGFPQEGGGGACVPVFGGAGGGQRHNHGEGCHSTCGWCWEGALARRGFPPNEVGP